MDVTTPGTSLHDAYVVLGYGSLIWDLEILASQVQLPWLLNAGPELPMEFSRISAKRLMGLVVVIDAVHGSLCPTHAILSNRTDIHAVADDLCARERSSSLDYIGAVCRRSGFSRSYQAEVAAHINAWCERTGAAGAVWTDLPQNFAEHAGSAFSIDDAIAYLRTLRGENLAEAVRYIENAPDATDTPLRRALARDAWWQGLSVDA